MVARTDRPNATGEDLSQRPLVAKAVEDFEGSGMDVPLAERIARLEKDMRAAAKRLEFEEAAALRDQIKELRELQIYAG